MKEYILTSLKAGLNRQSSSPAGAGFFFVEKKDGTLRPCIGYSLLNDITIKTGTPSHLCHQHLNSCKELRSSLNWT